MTGGPADVELRRATPADARAMADAHVDSIRTLGPAAYGAALVDAWAAAVTPEMYLRAMSEGEVFFIAVAPGDGEVLGFASHVPHGGNDGASVYVRGGAARHGIGSRLWQLAEAHARAHGAATVTIQASLGAVPFYRAQGFDTIGTDEAVLQNGAVMPCVVMRKQVAVAPAE